MIKGSELENREAGPPPRGAVAAEEALKLRPHAELALIRAELEALKARIARAHDMRPPRGTVDGSCWGAGRDAALAAVETPD